MRACRFFLGIGRYTPYAAVMGDMGWILLYRTQWNIKVGNGVSSLIWNRIESTGTVLLGPTMLV